MNLWKRIVHKWETLPSDAVMAEFLPRLMLHLAHGGWFSLLACVGWQLGEKFQWTIGGQKWHWALGVTVLMFGREFLQRLEIRERWWSCIFDTVQVSIVFFVMFLSDAKWWQAGVSLVAFCVLYVFFLLRDEDWIQEEK